jgi:hypothetical protein
MPGVELRTSEYYAHVVVALQPRARRLMAVNGKDEAFRGQASRESAVAGIAGRRRRYPWRRLAVRTARPGRAAPSRTGYRVIAAGAPTAQAGPLRGRMRRRLIAGP